MRLIEHYRGYRVYRDQTGDYIVAFQEIVGGAVKSEGVCDSVIEARELVDDRIAKDREKIFWPVKADPG